MCTADAQLPLAAASATGSDAEQLPQLPQLLAAAPGHFRKALAAARTGAPVDADALALLERTAALAERARAPCGACERVACAALAAEAERVLPACRAVAQARHVSTAAQAACFVERWRAWLRARERLLAGASTAAPAPGPPPDGSAAVPAADLQSAAYVTYDAARYDFGGLVRRIFAGDDGSLGSAGRGGDARAGGEAGRGAEQRGAEREPARAAAAADELGMLHATAAGRAEAGYLSDAARWAAAGGCEYSKELDDATRFGCGSFNRKFKASALRADFLALYERFVAEVVAPLLGSPDLLYQASPVFRVYLPGHLAVGPRHTDAGYHAQRNEINFWVPLTHAHGSNSLLVESAAGAGDFAPIACGPGVAYRFRGNACEHLSELNVEGTTRVSFDFRVIRSQELHEQPVPEAAAAEAPPAGRPKGETRNGRSGGGAAAYFAVGRYYKRLRA